MLLVWEHSSPLLFPGPVRGPGLLRPWLSTGWVPLRPLLSAGSQPWPWDNTNCPSSSPHSSWPSHPTSASGPIPAARHSQLHPPPICPNVPMLDSLLLDWLSTFLVGALRDVRGTMMAAALRGPGLSSPNSHIPGEKTLFWRRLLGSGIGLACRGARAPGAHTPLLQQGCGFAVFPGFSRSGSTFGSPSRLTVSKYHRMCYP